MKRQFEDILNECLERLSKGESIQDCLNAHPEQARELAPLLGVARATQDFASAIVPRAEFKAQALYRLNHLLAERRARRSIRWWTPAIAKPVILAVALVALLVGGAGATTAAANSSVPGEPLYFVKMMKERVITSIPRSEIDKARLNADLAGVREREMAALASRGDAENMEEVALRLHQHLEEAASVSAKGPQAARDENTKLIKERIKENWQQHQKTLEKVMEKGSPGARSKMQKTMENSSQRFEEAVARLGEMSGVVSDVDAMSRSIILKPRFGRPLRLTITGSTQIKVGGQEVSLPAMSRFQGEMVTVDYDPGTMEAREIHLTRPR